MSLSSSSGTETINSESSELATRWLQADPGGRGTRRDAVLRALRSLGREDPSETADLDLRGVSLTGEDLSGLNLTRCDLSGADLTGADLSNAILGLGRLRGATLCKAKLDGCELFAADLTDANLNECSAEKSGLGAVDLTRASLIGAQLQGATLSKSQLRDADLRAANLQGARISEADLTGARFTRANLQQADLKHSDVRGAIFELADLRQARLLGLKNFDRAAWVGADIRDVDVRGAYLIRRHIADENYLYEFRVRSGYHRILYALWWASSDCGRSIGRWALCVVGVTLLFAWLHSLTNVDYGANQTAFSPIYYSVVTLTTLGYGDVLPASVPAQVLAVLQALLGYVGLGGLLSILANKMARRAE